MLTGGHLNQGRGSVLCVAFLTFSSPQSCEVMLLKNHHLCFTDEETEGQRSQSLAYGHRVRNSGARIGAEAVQLGVLCVVSGTQFILNRTLIQHSSPRQECPFMGCSLRAAIRAVRSVQVCGRARPVVAVPLGGPAGPRWLEGKKPSHLSQALPQE